MLFSNATRLVAERIGLRLSREPETGRGPVDFEFSNGITSRVLLEFKITSHRRLLEGLDAQLIEYMKGAAADSGIFVCIGFDEKAQERFNEVRRRTEELRAGNPNLFLHAEFIDARRRHGASRRA